MNAGAALKGLLLVVIVAASFGAAYVFGMGGLSAINAKPHVVDAGGFRFTYPKAWKQLSPRELPAAGSAESIGGQVVAGLCALPTASAKTSHGGTGKSTAAAAKHGGAAVGSGSGCAAPVDVMYVLFSERAGFPDPASLEHEFDASLGKHLPGFKKVDAAMSVTADGTPYLRYELTFRGRTGARHEILAAYRAGTRGVVAVANGPADTFGTYRAPIVDMLEQAHEQTG